jgi:hypothetical protein
MLEAIATVAGLALIAVALLDAFETIVLPRRVTRRFRLARFITQYSWVPWRAVAQRLTNSSRETFLSFYGPLSLIVLIMVWAALMVLGFGLVMWGVGSFITPSGNHAGFGGDIYVSGTTFFTLGLGDVRPDSSISRVIAVIEGGSGFGFLALVITYLPVLYQAFSRREVNVSLLDARAGSPPSAGEFFRRLSDHGHLDRMPEFLRQWELWAAELLEIHLSYPVLTLYRSQHERQSWLASLTFILDVSSLALAGAVPAEQRQARLTFAMARHAAVDLSQMVARPASIEDRLPEADFPLLLAAADPLLQNVNESELRMLRSKYEPNVVALSRMLLMPLPSWLPSEGKDAWQSSLWE